MDKIQDIAINIVLTAIVVPLYIGIAALIGHALSWICVLVDGQPLWGDWY